MDDLPSAKRPRTVVMADDDENDMMMMMSDSLAGARKTVSGLHQVIPGETVTADTGFLRYESSESTVCVVLSCPRAWTQRASEQGSRHVSTRQQADRVGERRRRARQQARDSQVAAVSLPSRRRRRRCRTNH